MTVRGRIVLIVLWVTSLLVVAQWSGSAQEPQAPGVEVRLIPSDGRPGAPHGTLVGYFNGQWLPVTVDVLPQPDPNSLLR
jgi:hypothetical protein